MNRATWMRLLILILVSTLGAALMIDWRRAPADELQAGDVAPRTIKAPVTFTFQDIDAFQRQREAAEAAVLPVFVHQPELTDDLVIRLRTGFANARALTSSVGADRPADFQHSVQQQLERDLRVGMQEADVAALMSEGFQVALESYASDLLTDAMGQMVVADRSVLRDQGGIRVLSLEGDTQQEDVLRELDPVKLVAHVRQQISLRTLDTERGGTAAGKAAGAVARQLVRPNLTYSPIETRERQKRAAQDVRLTPNVIKRGTVLFREGDTLTDDQIHIYAALHAQQGEQTILLEWLARTAFLVLMLTVTYNLGSTHLPDFSRRVREAASAGVLFLLSLLMCRLVFSASESVATLLGYEAVASSVWFVVPIAGTVMLVRLLMGLSWAVVYTIAVSVGAGLVMDLQALPMAYFLISGLTGAAAVSQTRERIAVLKAGVGVALMSALAVLVIHFLQLYVVDGEITMATTMRPVWSMLFALISGIVSAFLVLGLTPVFESLGFVTDYRLMELANLNHPLMRQLMLRAPGSYHHSVMVGSLAEAAAEAIGANALQAKVASYFHDIGKSMKPRYFVENEGQGGSRHTGLDPVTSAQIIISHVTEGGRMAAEHNLPKPIQDNIWMHHGTGILQYFYAKAKAEGPIDERNFRYPGPKPNNREAGIIMLADKVEAATRTIKDPNEDNIRTMIGRIVSSVMADDQFSECPLTFQEIHTIADTFVTVLLGIHHQRIEYPETADLSKRKADSVELPREALITLEIHPPTPVEPDEPVAQGQQARPVNKVPTSSPMATAPSRRRRSIDQGDVMPAPVTMTPGSAYEEEGDYEAMAHLPGSEE